MTPARAQAIARVGERRIESRRTADQARIDRIARALLDVHMLESECERLREIIRKQAELLDSHACEECGRGHGHA
jgi:hypothetical protein